MSRDAVNLAAAIAANTPRRAMRPDVGDRVRSKNQKEIQGVVTGLKMNCVLVRLPSGRIVYWNDGSYERLDGMPEYVAQVHDHRDREAGISYRYCWYVWPKGKELKGRFAWYNGRSVARSSGHAAFRWTAKRQLRRAYRNVLKEDAANYSEVPSVVYDVETGATKVDTGISAKEREKIRRDLAKIEKGVRKLE